MTCIRDDFVAGYNERKTVRCTERARSGLRKSSHLNPVSFVIYWSSNVRAALHRSKVKRIYVSLYREQKHKVSASYHLFRFRSVIRKLIRFSRVNVLIGTRDAYTSSQNSLCRLAAFAYVESPIPHLAKNVVLIPQNQLPPRSCER